MNAASKLSVACALAVGCAACTIEHEPGIAGLFDASLDGSGVEPDAPLEDNAVPDVDAAQQPDGSLGIGNPCTSDSDCVTGTCILNVNYAGGYCTIRNCVPTTGEGCPPDTVCRGRGGVMSTMCFARCPSAQPCRTGYRCCDLDAATGNYCVPVNSTACY